VLVFVALLPQVPLGADSDDDVPFAVKSQIRGQKTVALLRSPTAMRDMSLAALLAGPLEEYRCKVDFANKLTSSVDDFGDHKFGGDRVLTQAEKFSLAAAKNAALLSGAEGEAAVLKYGQLLQKPFKEGDWDLFDISFSSESLNNAVQCLTIAIGETWRRLVFPFKSYPWMCITSASVPSSSHVAACIDRARGKQLSCPQCVDNSCTGVLIAAREAKVPEMAIFNFCSDILATCRVSSINVECQHVHHQEVASKDHRSRCKLPSTIQTSTFQKSVAVEHARMKKNVMKRHVSQLCASILFALVVLLFARCCNLCLLFSSYLFQFLRFGVSSCFGFFLFYLLCALF
jgi:hypothetical protein